MSNPSSMTPERWQRLQALFDQALALEPQARAEFVVAECGVGADDSPIDRVE